MPTVTDRPDADAPPSLRQTLMLDFDPDAMTMALQDGVLEHVQLGRGRFHGRIAHTCAPGSRIDWGRYTLAILARGDLSREMVTITIALTGHGGFRVQGRGATAGDLAVFPEGGELLVALPTGAQWLSLQLPRQRLESAGLAVGRCIEAGARRMAGIVDDELVQVLLRLAPVIAPEAGAVAFGEAAVELAHGELIDELLSRLARRGGASDAGSPLSPGERWRVVRRAEAFLEAQADPAVRIEDLCRAAATSLSRLERAFRETFGMSPHRYLTLGRLGAVRRELLRRGASASVTEVAMRWGFFHLGRFAQDYRRHFAELPSQTVRAR